MNWEEREVLLIVKTYPATSKSYGDLVCTAGIFEDTEEWVRIYPITWLKYAKNNLKKFVRFKAILKPDESDYLSRKESYKIKQNTIKITDTSLTKPSKKGVWEERTRILKKIQSSSVEELRTKFQIDKTSLGIIKPRINTVKFRNRKPLEDIEINVEATTQYDLFGEKINKVDEIEKAFSYKFKCDNLECKGHDIICEDWELLEAFRSWQKKYPNFEVLKEKLYIKFQDWMVKRDLYFIMGTHWKFPTWIIIGLFYPPKIEKSNKESGTLLI